MNCKHCNIIVFSDRKIEGARQVSEDSVKGKEGALYLMDPEVVSLVGKGGIITDRGRLATVV